MSSLTLTPFTSSSPRSPQPHLPQSPTDFQNAQMDKGGGGMQRKHGISLMRAGAGGGEGGAGSLGIRAGWARGRRGLAGCPAPPVLSLAHGSAKGAALLSKCSGKCLMILWKRMDHTIQSHYAAQGSNRRGWAGVRIRPSERSLPWETLRPQNSLCPRWRGQPGAGVKWAFSKDASDASAQTSSPRRPCSGSNGGTGSESQGPQADPEPLRVARPSP